MDKQVILKEGREKPLLQRHPWIFSGAIASIPPIQEGEVLSVHSVEGQFLAKAYFHPHNSIAGRVLTFFDEPVSDALSRHLDSAIALRKTFIDPQVTNCYRLVNAEGDGIPGLIVDCYGDLLVIQINTAGIERCRPLILDLLQKKLQPRAIFEKSTSSARKLEGLPDRQGWIRGEGDNTVVVKENGLLFSVSLDKGQKTGFFLDQREMRSHVEHLSRHRKVLNCFSYSGGFSLYALRGGASHVTSVDCNADAISLCQRNTELNGFDLRKHQIVQADVFSFLAQAEMDCDLMILDPPAFAKKRGDIPSACSGYKEINRLCMERCPPSSLLLTSSCSHFIDRTLFQNVIFQAALASGRHVQILSHHSQALDHPLSLNHPEGEYLKSLLLFIQ